MSPSAIATPTGRSEDLALPVASKGSLEGVTKLGFKGSQAGVEQFAFRDDDDVEAGRELVATEDLSNQSFSSISLDRAAQFPGSGNSQPAHRQVVREREQGQKTPVCADAAVINLLIFRTAADPFVRPQRVHAGFRP